MRSINVFTKGAFRANIAILSNMNKIFYISLPFVVHFSKSYARITGKNKWHITGYVQRFYIPNHRYIPIF